MSDGWRRGEVQMADDDEILIRKVTDALIATWGQYSDRFGIIAYALTRAKAVLIVHHLTNSDEFEGKDDLTDEIERLLDLEDKSLTETVEQGIRVINI
jgi:hypothetical protein